jgi:5-formyltetrahydrofolate cyclo-ligase
LKLTLRAEVKTRTQALTAEQRELASRKATDLLEKQMAWKEAKTILFYAPLPDELDIWRLFEDSLCADKRVFLPKFLRPSEAHATRPSRHGYVACEVTSPASQLRTGRFGIREPNDSCPEVPLNRLDFVLVPGVAFDLHGRRVGRGKGYYDHLLADVRGKTCGVGFDEQIVTEVPVEPHDVLVNCILTPSRWIEL